MGEALKRYGTLAGVVCLAAACAKNQHAVAASHFATAQQLVRVGLWGASFQEFTQGCAAELTPEERAACDQRAVAIYAGHDGSPAPPASGAPAAPVAPPPKPEAILHGAPQPGAYAIVIGIEHYEGLPPPTGAVRDAQRFADVAKQTLGLADSHVTLLIDGQATKGAIERALAATKANVKKGARIYFFYSGHGAPDTASGAAYIVPSDGDPKYLPQTTLSVADVVGRLSSSPAGEVLAMFDSCFSGAGGRSVLPAGARPLVRVKETTAPPGGHVAVFSAADGTEISGPSADGTQGVFSKYLEQGLGAGSADADGDGQITLRELADWVTPRVTREASDAHREQHPTLKITGSDGSAFVVGWGLPPR